MSEEALAGELFVTLGTDRRRFGHLARRRLRKCYPRTHQAGDSKGRQAASIKRSPLANPAVNEGRLLQCSRNAVLLKRQWMAMLSAGALERVQTVAVKAAPRPLEFGRCDLAPNRISDNRARVGDSVLYYSRPGLTSIPGSRLPGRVLVRRGFIVTYAALLSREEPNSAQLK